MSSSRRSVYKLPPSFSTLTSVQQSQAARREKALEEQKRKRALKFDISRFASLKLGDDEDEDEGEEGDGDEEIDQDGFKVVHSAIASFASEMANTSPAITANITESSPAQNTKPKSRPKSKKKKGRKRASSNAQWADKIMYAELLEMPDSDIVASTMELDNDSDGLPPDLHTSWVALSPVPVGKRCLAITRDGPGRNPVPRSKKPRSPRDHELNTSLRSRLHGKHISLFSGSSSTTNPGSDKSDSWFFPSPLPPSTILDCILDENWTQNGILHVLDVLRWKGQEVGECEAGMRFWWRDTRLNELSTLPLPSQRYPSPNATSPQSTSLSISSVLSDSTSHYTFPYPTTLLPVPYHAAPLSLSTFINVVVPASRNTRSVSVNLPIPSSSLNGDTEGGDMDVDVPTIPLGSPTQEHSISPDGLLLYLAEASYESGSSPLSNWIPLRHLSSISTLDNENMDEDIAIHSSHTGDTINSEGPLDQFERLLRIRAQRQGLR
ncbi:hypothetical protein DFJ43DRAFT_1077124 [Lentinula guzmanii]|uniref:Snurportin-1 n=1 Tax=Lentinula guzmanii TaxID=2804957 RepID=A0AA38N087_9AGAR|nr:hypothetical protein DFJ43DRAFT_1077124 [Lentinula guzmanii]